jgi:DNA polymerase elongation subunit (family B)
MSYIVFDIETVGISWEELDVASQAYLLKFADTEDKQQEVKETLGFYPLTGEIVAIGLYDPDKDIRSVYFQAPNYTGEARFQKDGVHYIIGSESEILELFWATVRKYSTFITFNGREFDCPYIMMRSAVHRIQPTRNLMPYRYADKEHVDLLDQLTFYRATRKFTLDYFCKRFGIVSPKEEGVTGQEVPQMYHDERYLEIAEYCMRDVVATGELFQIWKDYISLT